MSIFLGELLTGSGYLIVEIDENSPSPSYYAYLRPDGSYVFVKETTSGNVRSSRYYKVDSFETFATDWANRASLVFNYPLESSGWS